MLPEEAILGRLLRPDATTGPLVNTQVFPDYWPEAATPPGIVYERRPQGDYDYTHFGHLSNVRARWQFHIYTEQEDKLTKALSEGDPDADAVLEQLQLQEVVQSRE